MHDELSLRERKKQATHGLLRRTAIELFTERGFDEVSVATIAEEAGVSKMTVFNYFGTKEDLVFGPLEEHTDDTARAVRERAAGDSAVAAVREQFLAALARHDPVTGLCDNPLVLQVRRLIMATPSLTQRALGVRDRSESALAGELETQAPGSSLTARVAAAQIMQVCRVLVHDNAKRLSNGESIDAVYPEAVANVEAAFALLESGLGSYCKRSS